MVARCGTLSGRNQHYRTGTPVCASCKKAAASYANHWKWATQHGWTPPAKNGLPEVIADVVVTHHPVTISEVPALVAQVRPGVNLASVRRVTYRLLERGTLQRQEGSLVAP